MSDLVEPLPGTAADRPRRRGIGYALYLTAATLFALNATVSKSILLSGFPAARLSQLRVTAACVLLVVALLLTNRPAFRLQHREIPLILVYGVAGVAMTQYLYFVAVSYLPVGIAVLLEFTSPVLVTLWYRFGRHQPVDRRVWLALGIALLGLTLVAQVWQGFTLNATGLLAGAGAAVAVTIWFLLGEHGLAFRDPVSLTMWGFVAASAFWAVVLPWWSFPWSALDGTTTLPWHDLVVPVPLLVAWMVALGTAVPFWLSVESMRHLTAAQASTAGITEPVIATGIAWLVLGEVLEPVQLLGGLLALGGILLAERSR